MAALAVLTYHPIRILDNTYAGNDLIALESDLRVIERSGIPIRSLDQLLTAPPSERLIREAITGPAVAITFDDGSIFDFVDRTHPTLGPQSAAASILERAAHSNRSLAGARPLASTFVIASPDARRELDRRDYLGGNYWPDDWWREATRRGMLGVESHSWDHNHPSLERTAQRDNIKGTFRNMETACEAEAEIAQSLGYITRMAGRAPRFFAYPWGEASKFLVEEYLPTRGVELGLWAALSGTETSTGYVTERSNRWLLPRFVCAHDWKSGTELEKLLQGLIRSSEDRSNVTTVEDDREASGDWRAYLQTCEIGDARGLADDLFVRSFGHHPPDVPRHFVLLYRSHGSADDTGSVVAYCHHRAYGEVYLGGGMCVDERAYRRFPRWLFRAVRDEGGLATIISRDSIAMLGDSPACFGYVGEPRARQADMRTGFVETGHRHLMVFWRRALSEDERKRLVSKVAAVGPF